MAITSRHAVALYWAGREGARRAPLLALRLDMGEPACFGCGVEASGTGSETERWNDSGLERAHMTAAALGGEDAPENLVLLCSRCHADAPMVADPAAMLRWVTVRENSEAAHVREALAELGRLGVTVDDGVLSRADAVVAAVPGAVEEVGAASHSGRMSPATLALVAKRAMEKSAGA